MAPNNDLNNKIHRIESAAAVFQKGLYHLFLLCNRNEIDIYSTILRKYQILFQLCLTHYLLDFNTQIDTKKIQHRLKNFCADPNNPTGEELDPAAIVTHSVFENGSWPTMVIQYTAIRGVIMQRINKLIILALFAFGISGCASSGEFRGQGTTAGVNLSSNNYKIIKAAAMGESSGFRLFGIIPFASPTYSEAKASLYTSVGQTLEGRSIALVNQTEDKSSNYYILFSLPKITITADIIEYLDVKK